MKKYIPFLLFISSCAYPITDTIPDVDILNFLVGSDNKSKTLPADGSSIIELNAIIPANAASGKRTITFNTSEGAFASSNSKTDNLVVDINGKATIQLRSTQSPLIAYVSAEIEGYKRTERIEFIQAFPDKIAIETGTQDYKIKDSSYPVITTKLSRNIGKPSLNTEVILDALDSLKINKIGIFKNQTVSNSSGDVTANLVIDQLKYRGRCIIKATVNKSGSQSIVGESYIKIVD
jgi:hypothetical protein